MKLLHVNIEPTNKCQLNCKYCGDRKTREEGFMTMEKYGKILNVLPHPVEIRLFLSGEPLLHPNIGAMVVLALERGHNVLIHTNGLELDAHTYLIGYGVVYPRRITIKVSIMDGILNPTVKENVSIFNGFMFLL